MIEDKTDLNDALIDALSWGEADKAREALDLGADPSALGSSRFGTEARGYSGLHIASVHGDEECVRLLLERGADPNAKSLYGDTPLVRATAAGERNIAVLLLAAGADPNLRCAGEITALHWAAEHHDDMTRLLLDAGADPMARTAEGDTPLHWAATAETERPESCLALIVAGADPDARNLRDKTPAELAEDRLATASAILAGREAAELDREIGKKKKPGPDDDPEAPEPARRRKL